MRPGRALKKLTDLHKQVAHRIADGKHSSVIANELGYSEAWILDIQHRLRKFYGAKNTIGLMIKLRGDGYGTEKSR